ncbi:MAG: hypothetical protein D6757_11170 [Alphaproteobacteria bacterium]|nr:MAG: hypothetical protein D6757_11170 [Alphaproteobacteria bacterium]
MTHSALSAFPFLPHSFRIRPSVRSAGAVVPALVLTLMLFAGKATAVSAHDEPPQPSGADVVRNAERAILDACIREEGTSAVRCGCYVATLKKTLPSAHYDTMVRLAAAGMTGDMQAFENLIAEEELDPQALEEMIQTTDRALKAAEKICEAR